MFDVGLGVVVWGRGGKTALWVVGVREERWGDGVCKSDASS